MAFSFVKDKGGKIYGVWVANEADANNQTYLITLFIRGGLKSEQIAGNLRVVPNRVDNKGGFFVMLGSYPAPGENLTKIKESNSINEKTVSPDTHTSSNITTETQVARQYDFKCTKCGSSHFDYDNYWKEYTCIKCGWIKKSLE